MTTKSDPSDVLIVGAGPTGLILALWLVKLGINVRIIDKLAEPGTTSRALAVQARTLEFYRQIGLAQSVIDHGYRVPALNLWVRGAPAVHVPLETLGQGVTAFPTPLIFPQDEHERLLIERLSGYGVEVERCTELLGFEDNGQLIRAALRKADSSEEMCEMAYLAGCDGARSKAREVLDIGFPGGTYDHLFYVADVEADGPPMNGELHVDLDEADFLAVFPLKGEGRARLIGSVREDVGQDHEQVRFEDVQDRALRNLKINVKRVNWFSTYRVHHRVARGFRAGRAFLLGDAAHIHSPLGGQGMNTGIGDAVNLAWKLASALKASSNERLLDSYEPERITFARRLVATTDRAFTGVVNAGALARFVRTQAIPVIAPALFRWQLMRNFVFRTISQVGVNYRGGPLSAGKAGSVSGGDRLPWVQMQAPDEDNYVALRSLNWQIHVYGAAATDVKTLSDRQKIALHVFPWSSKAQQAGLRRDGVYLVRPDGYVAMANPHGSAAAISAYFRNTRISVIPWNPR